MGVSDLGQDHGGVIPQGMREQYAGVCAILAELEGRDVLDPIPKTLRRLGQRLMVYEVIFHAYAVRDRLLAAWPGLRGDDAQPPQLG